MKPLPASNTTSSWLVVAAATPTLMMGGDTGSLE